FDSSVISLDKILYIFLRSVDVTDDGGQFCDRGESYRTAIFTKNKSQNEKAHSAIENAQDELGKKIVTKVLELKNFYIAEGYHQNYYKGENFVLTRFGPRKQSKAYKLYRNSCQRDDMVKKLWGSSAQFTE
ncbi:peptide-methionine (S)-S-oxide reductase, partial [bacterium]|nr:peptide-methionine (S)-S-oxide reductase [bacterium]